MKQILPGEITASKSLIREVLGRAIGDDTLTVHLVRSIGLPALAGGIVVVAAIVFAEFKLNETIILAILPTSLVAAGFSIAFLQMTPSLERAALSSRQAEFIEKKFPYVQSVQVVNVILCACAAVVCGITLLAQVAQLIWIRDICLVACGMFAMLILIRFAILPLQIFELQKQRVASMMQDIRDREKAAQEEFSRTLFASVS